MYKFHLSISIKFQYQVSSTIHYLSYSWSLKQKITFLKFLDIDILTALFINIIVVSAMTKTFDWDIQWYKLSDISC